MSKTVIKPSLKNPFEPAETLEFTIPGEIPGKKGGYEEAMKEGHDLIQRPIKSVSIAQIEKQHFKKRMTVWERIRVLTENEPNILYQNWGKNLDGASLVTGILNVNGRDVAVYGHDFTVRAGSIDATNGRKLALLFQMAGEKGIPLIGMNDSAGAFVPAGVGGLDGYAEAFTALRKISGVVPSIMCMFGFNAGGGSYLPRQGSFLIQPQDTFFGLTGPAVESFKSAIALHSAAHLAHGELSPDDRNPNSNPWTTNHLNVLPATRGRAACGLTYRRKPPSCCRTSNSWALNFQRRNRWNC